MSSLETARGRIGYLEAGKREGLPIVFLHGVGSDKSVWRPQLDHFGKDRRAVAFDYPGYGESELIDGATRDGFAESILAAMNELAIERAHVCGLSLGGVIAIALHSAAPQRVASLIIADSFAVHPDGPAIFERSIATSHAMSMRELAEARSGALLGSAASDELKAEIIEVMGRIDPAAFRIGAGAVWLAEQRDRAAAIAVPTLVLVGDEDNITPPYLSEELHRLIPGSRLEYISKAGHLTNAEQPDAFNRAVESFLCEHG